MAEIERIIFLQNESEELDTAFAFLDEEGPEGAIGYLSGWHYPGEHETAEEPGGGTSDHTHENADGYILTWNNRLGYIGLECRVA